MEIIVIGTEPPCIRCLTTYKRAQEAVKKFPIDIDVKKVAIHTPEAEKYGKVDSGHGIAEAGKVPPDVENMKRLMGDLEELASDEMKNESLIDAKLKELEVVLQPIKDKAKELGYLMTPVLVVNGEVKTMDDILAAPLSVSLVVNASSVSSPEEAPEMAAQVEKLNLPDCELLVDLNYGRSRNFWHDLGSAKSIPFQDGLATLANQAKGTFALWTGIHVEPVEFLKALEEVS